MISSFRKNILKLILIIPLIFCFYDTAYAVEDYTVLAPLPGTTVGTSNTATFQSYLPGLFKLAIGISAVLAFVMITIGGIMYATSDAITGKENGKSYITNAIWGLLLVIGAWAILYTINPKMLEFDLNLPVPSLAKPENTVISGMNGGVVSGYMLSPTEIANDASIVADLNKNHVYTNAPVCAGGETKNCTNVVFLPQNAITGVKNLAQSCGCDIKITGGTEGGHVTHGKDKPVMDLNKSSSLDSYIDKNKVGTPIQTKYGPIYQVKVGNQTVSFLDEGATAPGSTGAHWHVVFP